MNFCPGLLGEFRRLFVRQRLSGEDSAPLFFFSPLIEDCKRTFEWIMYEVVPIFIFFKEGVFLQPQVFLQVNICSRHHNFIDNIV